MSRILILVFNVLTQIYGQITEIPNSEVRLPYGSIKGEVKSTITLTKYYSFQGVPYAKPPVGSLRFKVPQEPEPWNETLRTTSDSKICYQIRTVAFPFVSPTLSETEDCLRLNIYIPQEALSNAGGKLPVMVFIHGGGFNFGFGSTIFYGPDYLMEHGVILVTINYRLGVFGFLTTEDDSIPANLGLKDQLLALQWVKKNIRLFGGDPNKITLFGESAGAASIFFHLINPKSEGLFRAAIAQSGTNINPWAIQINAKENALNLAKKINSSVNYDNIYESLKDVSAEKLNKASQELYDEASNIVIINGGVLVPSIEPESKDALLTKYPYDSLASGDIHKIPIIMGMNSEEALNEVAALGGITNNFYTIQPIIEARDKNSSLLVPVGMNLKDENKLEQLGDEIKNFYCQNRTMKSDITCFVKYYSDNFISRGVIKTAQMYSQLSDVFFYQLSFNGRIGFSLISPDYKGLGKVAHFEDIYYLFQNPIFNVRFFPPSYVRVQDRILTMWTNFAKYLNPVPEKTSLLTTDWPVLEKGGEDLVYLDIDRELSLKSNPRNNSIIVWDDWFEKYAVTPYSSY